MISRIVQWWRAWWGLIDEEQPIDLPPKPEPSQIVKTKLNYETPFISKSDCCRSGCSRCRSTRH